MLGSDIWTISANLVFICNYLHCCEFFYFLAVTCSVYKINLMYNIIVPSNIVMLRITFVEKNVMSVQKLLKQEDGRLSWPCSLTHSGHFTLEDWSHVNHGSGTDQGKSTSHRLTL